jgi:hypothetical protein
MNFAPMFYSLGHFFMKFFNIAEHLTMFFRTDQRASSILNQAELVLLNPDVENVFILTEQIAEDRALLEEIKDVFVIIMAD